MAADWNPYTGPFRRFWGGYADWSSWRVHPSHDSSHRFSHFPVYRSHSKHGFVLHSNDTSHHYSKQIRSLCLPFHNTPNGKGNGRSVNRSGRRAIEKGGSQEMNKQVIPCFEYCNGRINSVENECASFWCCRGNQISMSSSNTVWAGNRADRVGGWRSGSCEGEYW